MAGGIFVEKTKMINVKITSNKIQMFGHACRKSPDGIDRVCAAVSALTCNLINSLEDLTHDKIQVDMDSGMTVIKWEKLTDSGKLLVDSWFLGIVTISKEYNCITFS